MNLLTNGRVITRDEGGKGYYEKGAVAYEGTKIVEVGEEAALRAKYPQAEIIGHAACRACEAVVALVHIGRVDEIDAKLRRVMHQPDRVRLGDGAAEGHGAEAQTGDGNAGSR